MSIQHVGTGRVVRTTALPTSAAGGFTACGWARLTGTRAGFSSLFEMLNTGISGTQINLGVISNTTEIQLYIGEGGATSGSIFDPGVDEWFFWGISQSGGELSLYLAAEASTAWDATWSASSVPYTAPNFTPNHIGYGGANNTVEPSLSICTLMGLWNEGKTSSFLLGQKALSDAGDTGATLLAFHVADGADLTADLAADRGGSSANLTAAGTGTVYSALYPTFGATITGTFTVEAVAVDAIEVTLSASTMEVDESVTVTVRVLDEGGLPFEGISVSLSSDDAAVAAVASSPLTTDANGFVDFTVNGLTAGSVTLTISADSGTVTDTAALTVADTPPVDLPEFYSLAPGFSPVTVMGSGIVGATVSLYLDDVLEDTEVVDGFGEWAIAVLRSPGSYDVTVTQTVGSKVSAAAGPVTLTVLAPSALPPTSGPTRSKAVIKELPAPPVTAGDPAEIQAPFKTPKAWPGE